MFVLRPARTRVPTHRFVLMTVVIDNQLLRASNKTPRSAGTRIFRTASSLNSHDSNDVSAACAHISRFFERNALGLWSKSNKRQRTVLLTSLIKQKWPSRDTSDLTHDEVNSNICRVTELRRNKAWAQDLSAEGQ
jgi:hypothetical protein